VPIARRCSAPNKICVWQIRVKTALRYDKSVRAASRRLAQRVIWVFQMDEYLPHDRNLVSAHDLGKLVDISPRDLCAGIESTVC
jgi:hypothetical protein